MDGGLLGFATNGHLLRLIVSAGSRRKRRGLHLLHFLGRDEIQLRSAVVFGYNADNIVGLILNQSINTELVVDEERCCTTINGNSELLPISTSIHIGDGDVAHRHILVQVVIGGRGGQDFGFYRCACCPKLNILRVDELRNTSVRGSVACLPASSKDVTVGESTHAANDEAAL